MPRPFHNSGLIARKPKKYAGLVEQAEHLNVPDVLARLTPEQRRTLSAYRLREAPHVVLVRTRKGALPFFWYVVCPRCRRRCEALHRPTWRREFLCRVCHGSSSRRRQGSRGCASSTTMCSWRRNAPSASARRRCASCSLTTPRRTPPFSPGTRRSRGRSAHKLSACSTG